MGRRVEQVEDLRQHFGDFGGRVWLNAAHQGPLPLRAADEAREAVEWKLDPRRLTTERFEAVPARLRQALAGLIGASAEEIVLTNGASYGLHLLANGLPLAAGEEVLLMHGDFPSNLLPWLGLEARGVRVRLLSPRRMLLSAEEVEAELSSATRVLCLSWVHSFSGRVADLEALGRLCRSRGVRFVVNTTQGLGARRLDLSSAPVDAVVNAGWKWLCGPYGTGFCWMRPELCSSLEYNQVYWRSMQTADDLARDDAELPSPAGLGARRYDLFSTANFFNFKPWTAALELLLELGPDRLAERDRQLVDRFLAGLDRDRFELVSPEPDEDPSTLILVSDRRRGENQALHRRLTEAGIDVAFRRGRLRLSPHFYNTDAEIDRALDVLHGG